MDHPFQAQLDDLLETPSGHHPEARLADVPQGLAVELLKELLKELGGIVGDRHVLVGDAAAGFCVDWTGRFVGFTPAVVRPASTLEVSQVLAALSRERVPVVVQGGNTGLVGGGVPLRGEVVLSLARLTGCGPVDPVSGQVSVGAGVTLSEVAALDPDWDLGVLIASRDSATVGGAVATNAGGLRVLRYGSMRSQVAGIEAVLSSGEVVSHMGGLVKDNTGYDYPGMLAGSEGTLAVITAVRLQLVPRVRSSFTLLVGCESFADVHEVAMFARRQVPGLLSAEFFTAAGVDQLVARGGLAEPFPGGRTGFFVLLEVEGDLEGPVEDVVGGLVGDRPCVVAQSARDRAALWEYRERHPEVAGWLGSPVKLDVSVPAARWAQFAGAVQGVVEAVDPGCVVVLFGHVADGNVHVNLVPAGPADGRHQDAVFGLVASLAGSISAEHGIGALKGPWLHLSRTPAEVALFARVRSAFDPAGILNPHVLPS